MSAPTKITFQPRWKELPDCNTPWGSFSAEMTMGIDHVYFPTEEKWKKDVHSQLQSRWGEIVGALRIWCEAQSIPLSIVDDAWIELPEKKDANQSLDPPCSARGSS